MTKTPITIAMSLMLVGLALAPAAAADPSPPTEPPCKDRYWELDLGPVEVVSRDSCSYSVEESDDGEGPIPEPPAAQPGCTVDGKQVDCSELWDELEPWLYCPGPNPLCWNGGP